MKFAICHPDKQHIAIGLCSTCYSRTRKRATCHPDRVHAAYGLCNPCYKKERRKTHPGIDNATKSSQLKLMYGITESDYQVMAEIQNHVCAICKNPNRSNRKYLSVDHDHKTGKVRGLLCNSCNLVLGMMADNPELLKSAASYLENSGTTFNICEMVQTSSKNYF